MPSVTSSFRIVQNKCLVFKPHRLWCCVAETPVEDRSLDQSEPQGPWASMLGHLDVNAMRDLPESEMSSQ